MKKERFVSFVGGMQLLAKNIVVEHDVVASLDYFLSIFGGGGVDTPSYAKAVFQSRTFESVDAIGSVFTGTTDFPHQYADE